jgi:hypothetical protein
MRFRILSSAVCSVVLSLPLFFPAPSLAADAAAIMRQVYNRADGENRSSTMTMTLENKQGRQRVRTLESYSKNYGQDRKSIMIFQAPADVKGTMFLSWEYDDPKREDDKWLYMPAMRKDRRISGTSRNEYFMGSDFTYDDMGRRHPSKDRYTFLGEEEFEGHDCWKIEAVPVESEIYAKRILLVGKDAKLILRGEYFDKNGLLKIFEAREVRKIDGFWTTIIGQMTNVISKHKTVLHTKDMQYNRGLDDAIFTVATLQRGRL